MAARTTVTHSCRAQVSTGPSDTRVSPRRSITSQWEARPIFRKLVLAMLAASLLLPVLASPVAAVGEGDCEHIGSYNDHSGVSIHPNAGFPNVRGIRAYITAKDRLVYCEGPDSVHGPSYWVALVPSAGNAYVGNTSAIMQIGVQRCELAFSQMCDGTPNIFFAIGGCGGYHPTPQYLGDAPSGGITFAVRRVTGGNYWLTAVSNGVTIEEVYVASSDAATYCWASGTGDTIGSQIYCERWDPGDNCGASGSKILFDTIRYQQAVDGGWYIPGQGAHPALTDSYCNETHVEMYCDVIEADAFRTWVVQQ